MVRERENRGGPSLDYSRGTNEENPRLPGSAHQRHQRFDRARPHDGCPAEGQPNAVDLCDIAWQDGSASGRWSGLQTIEKLSGLPAATIGCGLYFYAERPGLAGAWSPPE